MADTVEEFLLKYKVDVSDASRKLDSLNEKLEKLGKSGNKSVESIKTGIAGASRAFAVAGVAISAAAAVIIKAIHLATEAMKDYNEQANIARRTGLGPIAQDVIAGNMYRSSRGRITRADSRAAVDAVAKAVNTAYTDPTRNNSQNVKLRMMGISPVGPNGMVANAGDVMDKLSKRWSTMTEEMAEAEARLLDITPQAADAIRALGGAVTDTSGLTLDMAKRQAAAAESAKVLNEAVNGLETDFGTLKKVMADELLPVVSNFLKTLQEKVHIFTTEVNRGTLFGHLKDYYAAAGRKLLSGEVGITDLMNNRDIQSELWRKTQQKQTEEEAKAAQDISEKQDAAANKQHEAAEKLELNANQFSAAVAAMPGSLSMQQAFAMWAGEVAKGMTVGGAGFVGSAAPARDTGGGSASGSGNTLGIRNNNPGNIRPGAFATAHGATGVNKGFATFPTMEAGVSAHVALLGTSGYQGKTLSEIINRYAPPSDGNHHNAGYIADVARRTGLSADSVPTASQLPALAAAMQVFESGYRGRPTGAMGMNKGQQRMVADSVARRIGMGTDQFMREGATRGDVKYGIDAQRKALTDNIRQLENEVKSYKEAGKPLVANQKEGELYRMRQQMQMLDKFAPGLLDGAQPGGPVRTLGMPPIQITINGATDPVAVAHQVEKTVGHLMHRVVNELSSRHVA